MIGWRPSDDVGRTASSRLRCLHLVRYLRRVGYPVEVFRQPRVKGYQLVVLGKPYDGATCRLADALKRRGVRIVIDICDNYFYNPGGIAALASAEGCLRELIRFADAVVVSTEALREVILGAIPAVPQLMVIGDPVETVEELTGKSVSVQTSGQDAQRPPHRSLALRGMTSLVWFGISGSDRAHCGMTDLLRIRPFLEAVASTYPIALTVISNSYSKFLSTIKPFPLRTRYLPWRPKTFHRVLAEHDIAILPISPNPFTWCKSSNRLATALATGVAVVADYVPSLEPFREMCVLGRWEEGLRGYLQNPSQRYRDVARAKVLIDAEFRSVSVSRQWQGLFEALQHAGPQPGHIKASRWHDNRIEACAFGRTHRTQ